MIESTCPVHPQADPMGGTFDVRRILGEISGANFSIPLGPRIEH